MLPHSYTSGPPKQAEASDKRVETFHSTTLMTIYASQRAAGIPDRLGISMADPAFDAYLIMWYAACKLIPFHLGNPID